MKPSRTYNSFERFGEKLRLAMLLLLLGQIFYISLSNIKIPIPSLIVDKLLKEFNIMPPTISIRTHDSFLVGFSNIQISKIDFAKENKVFAKLEDLEIELNSRFLAHKNEAVFQNIELSKIIIDFQSDHKELLHGKNLQLLSKDSTSYQISGILGLAEHEIKILGKLNLPVRSNNRSGSAFDFLELLLIAEQKIDMALKYSEGFPPLSLEALLNFTDDSLHLYLCQINNIPKHLFDNLRLISRLEFSTNKNLHLKATADSIFIESKDLSVEFSLPKIDLEIDLSKDLSIRTLPNSRISINQVKFHGRLEGVFPQIVLQSSDTFNKLLYITDDQALVASTSSYWQDGYVLVRGFLNLNPDYWNLNAKLPQGTMNVIHGKSLNVRFSENLSPRQENSLTQFFIQADDVSVLESPAGDFRFMGEVGSDFNINIFNAYGKFGSSEAAGSYTQIWNPAKFRFLVKGNCLPSDIANWLGTWWMPLFKNFSFNDQAPYGDFSISGIWGGEPGNSQTYGSVIAKDLTYRNCHINDAQVVVLVEENSTELRAPHISHTLGSLSGSLLFPHNRLNSSMLLEFQVSGDFPFNDARKALGPTIENSLIGIDAPILSCTGNGKIFRNTATTDSNANITQFNIGIESVIPISYHGIPIQSLSGNVESVKGITKGNFPKVEIAEGNGVLFFEELSRESDRIKIKFNLDNADRYQLMNSLENVNMMNHEQNKENISVQIDDEQISRDKLGGKLNLSLLAEGPLSDPLQFKGSGICVLTDVEVGNINFLGGIRSKLGAFNLPLPSDALSFNRLEAPFHLDHHFIHCDEINLSGPLSLLTAKGSINIESEEVDLMADLKIAGNLNIPFIKQIVNFADPFPKMSTIKIAGSWENPDWRIHISPDR